MAATGQQTPKISMPGVEQQMEDNSTELKLHPTNTAFDVSEIFYWNNFLLQFTIYGHEYYLLLSSFSFWLTEDCSR